MRIVFAGTPEFSVSALDALVAAGHQVVAVFSQPDRPAGRGQKRTPSPVAARAQVLNIPCFTPISFKQEPEAIAQIRSLAPEVMVVVAYGLLLPQVVLDIPRYGCINIHASLLPRWRGAAPIQRAILAGDTETGVTIMQMDAGLDTGAMLKIGRVAITADDTSARIHDVLAQMGAELMVATLDDLSNDRLQPVVQPADGVTYAAKLTKEEAHIDWSAAATVIAQKIRGYDPVPVAWTECAGERIKIWAAVATDQACSAAAGTVLGFGTEGLRVATGHKVLSITRLQRPGGKAQAAVQLANSWNLQGQVFI